MKKTLLVLAMGLVGCTGTFGQSASESASPSAAMATEPPPAPSLSADEIVAEVLANAVSECEEGPNPFDELWCEMVDFDAITFAEGTLTVPTMLDAAALDDAEHVCSAFFASGSTTSHGDPMGIETIEILGSDGEVAASCSE